MENVALSEVHNDQCCSLLAGCGGLWTGSAKTDQRTVFVWPTEVCPSQSAGTPGAARSLGTVLLSTLMGNVVSGLVGIPAEALKAAADADSQGLKVASTNARYYYTLQSNAVTRSVDVIPPSCYVVAYARPIASGGGHWCDDPAFAKSVSSTCLVGHSRLAQLKVREELDDRAQPGIDGLSVPEMYFEVDFETSGYGDVVRPRIVAMHFPKSVLQPGSEEPRAITLQIDVMKAALNEVGNPHKFLQAFGASAPDYAKAITGEISPLGQATAQQTQEKNAADYTTALALAQKSRGDLLGVCAGTPPTTAQAKAASDSLLTTVKANQMKANLAADVASISPRPFSDPSAIEGSVSAGRPESHRGRETHLGGIAA